MNLEEEEQDDAVMTMLDVDQVAWNQQMTWIHWVFVDVVAVVDYGKVMDKVDVLDILIHVAHVFLNVEWDYQIAKRIFDIQHMYIGKVVPMYEYACVV